MPSWGESAASGGVGDRSMRALDVFFWRRAYVFEGVLRSAEVSEVSSLRLRMMMNEVRV